MANAASRPVSHAAAGADDEGDAAAVAARDRAGRQRAGRQPDHVYRERHGRERDVRGERRTDDRTGREDHRRIGAGQRLRRRQPHHIGPRARIVGDLVGSSQSSHRPVPGAADAAGRLIPGTMKRRLGAINRRKRACAMRPAFRPAGSGRTPGSDCWRASRRSRPVQARRRPPAFQARRCRARPIPDCCREGCCRTRHC